MAGVKGRVALVTGAAKYARIVSMSSTSARGNCGQANYSTAKAGLRRLTRTLAIELGPFGITANAIAPGFIETAIPVRRGGLPADVAKAAHLFASEESGYVTGQVLYVDGGSRLV